MKTKTRAARVGSCRVAVYGLTVLLMRAAGTAQTAAPLSSPPSNGLDEAQQEVSRLIEQGQTGAALERVRAELAAAPEAVPWLMLRGQIERANQDHAAALATYRGVLELEPGNLQAANLTALLHVLTARESDPGTATEHLAKAFALSGTNTWVAREYGAHLLASADAAATEGDAFRSLVLYEQVLAVEPGRGEALEGQARQLLELGCERAAGAIVLTRRGELTPAAAEELGERLESLAAESRAARAVDMNWAADDRAVLWYAADTDEETLRAVWQHLDHLKSEGLLSGCSGPEGPAVSAGGVGIGFECRAERFLKDIVPGLEYFACRAFLALPEGDAPTREEQARLADLAKNGRVTLVGVEDDRRGPIQINPQGDRWPALGARRYLPESGEYETAEEHRERVRQRIAETVRQAARMAGAGAEALMLRGDLCNALSRDAAQAAGVSALLLRGPLQRGTPAQAAEAAIVVVREPGLAALRSSLAGRRRIRDAHGPAIACNLDLFLRDGDSGFTAALDRFVERAERFQARTVYLQGGSDPGDEGVVREVYFPNRILPVQRDVLSHAACRLLKEGFEVYVRLPVLGVILPDPDANRRLQVLRVGGGTRAPAATFPRRLSPFNAQALDVMRALYADLAAHVPLSGVLFGFDAYLTDMEDFNPAAEKAYREAVGAADLDPRNLSAELEQQWTQAKTRQIGRFTQALADAVRDFRPGAATARQIFAPALHHPRSELWLAQNYAAALLRYDWVVEALAEPLASPAYGGRHEGFCK